MKTITPFMFLAVLSGAAVLGCGGSDGSDFSGIDGASGGTNTPGGSTAGGTTAGDSTGGNNTPGGTTSGDTGGSDGGSTGGTTGTPGEITSVNLGISDVSGNASTSPIASFTDAESSVTANGSTVDISVGQLNTGGLLSRTLNLVLNDPSIEVGDTYTLGTSGADASLTQALGLPTNIARWDAASGGTVRVIARDGDDVTLALENVRLESETLGGTLATGGLSLDGNVRFTLP